jgi:hypothetical protein
LTTSQKKELRKTFQPYFGPFEQIFEKKNLATNLFGRTYFYWPLLSYAAEFGQLAMLVRQAKQGLFEQPDFGKEQLCDLLLKI